jgi:hypothetical protein
VDNPSHAPDETVYREEEVEKMIERRIKEREDRAELERTRLETLRLEVEESAREKIRQEQMKAELEKLRAASERAKIEREVRERIQAEIQAKAEREEAETRRVQELAKVAQAAMKYGVDQVVVQARDSMLHELRIEKKAEKERFEAMLRAEIWAAKQAWMETQETHRPREPQGKKTDGERARPKRPPPPQPQAAPADVSSSGSSTHLPTPSPSTHAPNEGGDSTQHPPSETRHDGSRQDQVPDAVEPSGTGTEETSASASAASADSDNDHENDGSDGNGSVGNDSDFGTAKSTTTASRTSSMTSRRRRREEQWEQEDRERLSMRIIKEELVEPIADAIITGFSAAYGHVPPPTPPHSYFQRQYRRPRDSFGEGRSRSEARHNGFGWDQAPVDPDTESEGSVDTFILDRRARRRQRRRPHSRPRSRSRSPDWPGQPPVPPAAPEVPLEDMAGEHEPENTLLSPEGDLALRSGVIMPTLFVGQLLQVAPVAIGEVEEVVTDEDEEDVFEDALEEQSIIDNVDVHQGSRSVD